MRTLAVLLLLAVKASIGLLVITVGAVALTMLFGFRCRRSVGGVTGDLLGACSEFVELWVLLCGGILVS